MCNPYYALYVLKTQYENVHNSNEHILCIMSFAKSAQYVYNRVIRRGGVDMGTFGQRLKELRNERGISQNELSKYVGVSKSSINMYERDEREPGFETLEAIADFFNVSMDYLLGRYIGFHDENMNTDVIVEESGGVRLQFGASVSPHEVRKVIDELVNLMGEFGDDDCEISQNDMLQLLQNAFLRKAEKDRSGAMQNTDTTPSPDAPKTPPKGE